MLTLCLHYAYTDHGFFKVPLKARFALEMLNLVVMFSTFILNISVCIIQSLENQGRDQSSLPNAIIGSSIAQALVLLLIMVNSIYYWTRGGLLLSLYAMYITLNSRLRCCPSEGGFARGWCDHCSCSDQRGKLLSLLAALSPTDCHNPASWNSLLHLEFQHH